jgi:hypothetical protein
MIGRMKVAAIFERNEHGAAIRHYLLLALLLLHLSFERPLQSEMTWAVKMMGCFMAEEFAM